MRKLRVRPGGQVKFRQQVWDMRFTVFALIPKSPRYPDCSFLLHSGASHQLAIWQFLKRVARTARCLQSFTIAQQLVGWIRASPNVCTRTKSASYPDQYLSKHKIMHLREWQEKYVVIVIDVSTISLSVGLTFFTLLVSSTHPYPA